MNKLLKLCFFVREIGKEADMAVFQYVQSRRYKRIQKLMRRTEKLIAKRKRIAQEFERDNLKRYL